MSGGQATSTGIEFQVETAAWISSYVLAGAAPAEFELRGGTALASLLLEAPAAVDDIIAATTGAGFCFINVKSTVDISERPESALGSVCNQFVKQWLSNAGTPGSRAWEHRALDATRDRLVVAVDATKSAGFARAAGSLLARIRETGDLLGDSVDLNAAEGRLNTALASLIRASWARNSGMPPTDQQIADLLKLVRVVPLNLAGADLNSSLSLLRGEVLVNPEMAESAWTTLKTAALGYAKARSGGDRTVLQDVLRAAGIPLTTPPDYREDIDKLVRATQHTLNGLEHLASLRPHDVGQPLTIRRACADALADHAPGGSFLLIGEPGAGKSGALYAAARRLRDAGHPVLVLAVDRYPVQTRNQLESELGLTHPLTEVLSQWSSTKRGVLLIDALDASRGGPADRVFRELLGASLKLPAWSTVASIRLFDLRYGMAYQDLFPGKPVAPGFFEPEFSHVAHLLVRPLDEQELGQIWPESPAMQQAYEGAGQELRKLLHSPFNLFLLAAILRTGNAPIGAISTQIQLLDAYWMRRVGGSDAAAYEREGALIEITAGMVRTNALSIAMAELPATARPPLPQLLSVQLLLRTAFDTLSFSHHMLFDYAVARLILQRGHAKDLVSRLTGSDDHALLLAPAAMLAFRMLWSEDPEDPRHSAYWNIAVSIANPQGPGAFSKMLPARAMADLVNAPEDVELLVEVLASGDQDKIEAARFLIMHCFLAITTEITQVTADPRSPWPGIARRLAQQDRSVWPWKAVVGRWCERTSDVAPKHFADINALARQLIASALRLDGWDESSIACGVQGTVRTMETAVDESVAALRPLLEEQRVTAFGHKDLFWLAQEAARLAQYAPEFLAELYATVYCRDLPSAEEQTSLGPPSRILGLIGNKKQDFEGIRWQLCGMFPTMFRQAPQIATDVLLHCLDYFIRAEKHFRSDSVPVPFSILGQPVRYVPDDCGLWWDSRTGPQQDYDVPGLLTKFVSTLVELAGDRALLDMIVRKIAADRGWASSWNALLRAASTAPEKVGPLIVPMLSEPGILDAWDARYTAGKAIGACHRHWDAAQKKAVESAILEVNNDGRRAVLLACLDPDQIVSTDVAAARASIAKAGNLPENRPLIHVTTGFDGSNVDWFRGELGVDNDPREAGLYDLVKGISLEGVSPRAVSPQNQRSAVAGHWPKVLELRERLLQEPGLSDGLREHAWDQIAKNLSTAAENSESPEDLAAFPQLEETIVAVLDHAPWPSPQRSEEQEQRFAKQPSWGSSPRGYAAEALIALGKANRALRADQSERLLQLVRDGSPIVRHQILARVNMLIEAVPDFVKILCDIGFAEERNPGVLEFFLSACRAILGRWPAYFDEQIAPIEGRAPNQDDGTQRLELLVDLILRLWLTHNQPHATARARSWAERPIEFESRVVNALYQLHGSLFPRGAGSRSERAEKVNREAVWFFHEVTRLTAPVFVGAMGQKEVGEETKQAAQSALHILDAAMLRIYFASGAQEKRTGSRSGPRPDKLERSRFLNVMWPTLEVMATVPYPSVTHNFLQTIEDFIDDEPMRIFELLLSGTLIGGRLGGYQLEGLGADLFVKIVRRYLADYRDVLSAKSEFRKGLIEALDYFVRVGWPDARRLAYELPEMLR